jgi:hypothetical protein
MGWQMGFGPRRIPFALELLEVSMAIVFVKRSWRGIAGKGIR